MLSRMKRAFDFLFALLMNVVAYPLGRLFYGGKHIWLVGERPNQAQDNGYHFFKYLKENHPEQRVYYVITKDAAARKKVAALGDVIHYGSLRHWIMYFGCEALISTHVRSLVPIADNWHYSQLLMKHKQKNRIQVFLQHGIISADIRQAYKEYTRLDLFICGAKPEFDFIKAHFHYDEDEVAYTGLARYDALHDFTIKKQILLMPTWRTWLIGIGSELKNSEYVKMWNQVITDSELIRAAKEAGYQIIFYPHPKMQFARDLFESTDETVVIADENTYDVQTLLKESALLITDFSSVFFDFAYMRKPMLFFHFDAERHAAEHYQKGYFDYRRDGFGKVASTAPELVALIKEMLADGVALSEEFNRRIDRFFPLYDRHNCDRIYREIETRTKKMK